MNLMKFKNIYFIFSGLVIVPGLISLVIFGLKLGIDFTGGSLWEVAISSPQENLTAEIVAAKVQPVFNFDQIKQSGAGQYLLRGKTLSSDQKIQVQTELAKLGQVSELRYEIVGPTLGSELLRKTLSALVIVSAIITWFVAKQFKELKYGVSAILAMLHDSLVLLGVFSLLGYFFDIEVDVLFVTALLTTLSFSVHDTIVVFDRIRELHRKFHKISFVELCNVAVIETMGRSLNNSLTIIFMLLALVLLGGESIKWFAVALLVGSVTGTYSSTFTAVPLLIVWDEVFAKKTQQK